MPPARHTCTAKGVSSCNRGRHPLLLVLSAKRERGTSQGRRAPCASENAAVASLLVRFAAFSPPPSAAPPLHRSTEECVATLFQEAWSGGAALQPAAPPLQTARGAIPPDTPRPPGVQRVHPTPPGAERSTWRDFKLGKDAAHKSGEFRPFQNGLSGTISPNSNVRPSNLRHKSLNYPEFDRLRYIREVR